VTRCRATSSREEWDGVRLRACAVRALSGSQRALAARSISHQSGRGSAADRRPISAAALTLFFRGTFAPKRETSSAFAADSVQVFAFENRDLAS
jgi:hypothetical protein